MSSYYTSRLSEPSSSALRLILLGNLGCGKTSSADTILGQVSPVSPSASRSCQVRRGFSEGRDVTLVEAPRWYWNGGRMEADVRQETGRAVDLVAPGPHGILLLVPVSQFTEMECRVPAELEEVFGEASLDHTLVLLTCGDYLMGRTVEGYLQKEHPGLRQIIERCGGRYHVINNRHREDREQVHRLLEKVDNMVKQNGIFHMRTVQDREQEKLIRQQREHQERMEKYAAQQEEENKAMSRYTVTTRVVEETRRAEQSADLERRRTQVRDDVNERQVSRGLHSPPSSEPWDGGQAKRFRLNAEGAILSQATTSPKQRTTYYHRINSSEERSPSSPTSSSPSSPYSTLPSSPKTSPSSPYSSSQFTFAPASHSPSFTSSYSTFSSTYTSPSSSSPVSSSFPQSSSPSSSSSPELRLVLLGRSGAGKSAAGNRILGREEFRSHTDSLTPVTQECEKKKAVVEGRSVAVVDTPDWFNSECTQDEVRAQISSCVALSSPGPHAFLLCTPLDQPAKMELQALAAIETVFGSEAVQNYTMVLFTYADKLREREKIGSDGVEAYIARQRKDLLSLVEKCRDRFHVLDDNRRNTAELLEKVEQTVTEAGGQFYSSPAFQEAEKRVREKQMELARENRSKKLEQERAGSAGQLSSERDVFYPYMQTVAEAEEDVGEEEIEQTRAEAEMSVSAMDIQSLPPITLSSLSPSTINTIMDKIRSNGQLLADFLSNSSVWVSEGAKQVKTSPVWGKVGSGAQNVQKMVADSSVWGKVGAGARHASKAVGDRVPKVVVDGSTWVGSGAKAAANSPVWGKMGSGAKLMADTSVKLGTGIGSGAKNLAQSPVWGKVGSGAKLVADGSMQVGAGLGAGAKKVAQSPVWGKMCSGAKAGATKVAESPVWGKAWNAAKQVPMVVIAGALLGLLLGVFLGGVIGGAIGTAAGSALSEVGRRKYRSRNALGSAESKVDSLVKQGGKALKTE